MARKRRWIKFNREFKFKYLAEVIEDMEAELKEFGINLSELNDKTPGMYFSIITQRISGGWSLYTDSVERIPGILAEESNPFYQAIDTKLEMVIDLNKFKTEG